MGLFDEIYFELRLPIPDGISDAQKEAIEKFFDEDVFQTKDLDNNMDQYVVTKKRFLRQRIKYSEKTLFRIESDPIPINKNIICYAIININSEEKFWIEYEISFSNDMMNSAKLLKWHKMEK